VGKSEFASRAKRLYLREKLTLADLVMGHKSSSTDFCAELEVFCLCCAHSMVEWYLYCFKTFDNTSFLMNKMDFFLQVEQILINFQSYATSKKLTVHTEK
jgi:hypothetical protein